MSKILQKEDAYLKAIVDWSDDAIIGKDVNGIIITWNRAAERMFGYSETEAVGQHVSLLAPLSKQDEMPAILKRILEGETIHHYDTLRKHKDGREVEVSLTVSPIKDSSGRIVGASKIARDISEQKLVAKRVKQALDEKVILLHEIHHRVKNNLQIISSLLSIQAGESTSRETAAVLKDCERRVSSMAMIHQQLYGRDDMGSVDLATYGREMCSHLCSSFSSGVRSITCRVDAALTEVSIEQAVPCGLIINELVTNALKYAYPDRDGEILIGISSERDCVSITVSDKGVGMPIGFNPETSTSLGLTLVHLLASQINGHVEIGTAPGASFTVSFTKRAPVAFAATASGPLN